MPYLNQKNSSDCKELNVTNLKPATSFPWNTVVEGF